MRKRNKAIAAMLLVVLGSGSVPVAFAVGQRVHLAGNGQPTRHSPHEKRSHSCCPGVRSDFIFPVIVLANSEPIVPCSDRPCCAKRVPDKPALVTATPRMSLAEIPTRFSRDNPVVLRDTRPRAVPDFLSPYPDLSTVLRI